VLSLVCIPQTDLLTSRQNIYYTVINHTFLSHIYIVYLCDVWILRSCWAVCIFNSLSPFIVLISLSSSAAELSDRIMSKVGFYFFSFVSRFFFRWNSAVRIATGYGLDD
jgi:hypothetical protein